MVYKAGEVAVLVGTLTCIVKGTPAGASINGVAVLNAKSSNNKAPFT